MATLGRNNASKRPLKNRLKKKDGPSLHKRNGEERGEGGILEGITKGEKEKGNGDKQLQRIPECSGGSRFKPRPFTWLSSLLSNHRGGLVKTH